MANLSRRLYRDANDRIWFRHGGQVFELQGEFDCEYRSTQLLKVKTRFWKGKLPKGPHQFLGIVCGEPLVESIKAHGKWFGKDLNHVN